MNMAMSIPFSSDTNDVYMLESLYSSPNAFELIIKNYEQIAICILSLRETLQIIHFIGGNKNAISDSRFSLYFQKDGSTGRLYIQRHVLSTEILIRPLFINSIHPISIPKKVNVDLSTLTKMEITIG